MPVLEERVDSLESLLGQFIVHTDVALRRLEREMRVFKDEMKAYREESEKDRKALHEEMKEFKDEMKAYREESEKDRKVLHKEMSDFKDEMKEFKDEMSDFKKRQDEENRRKNKEWSNIAKKMGTIVEDLIAPALRPVLEKYFKCDVKLEGQRQFRRRDGEDFEIDAIAGCDDKIFMIEAKSTPREGDAENIKNKAKRFYDFFPEFKDRELKIIFASITVPENILSSASKNGIYVMAWREWEYMDILNFAEIQE